MKFNETGLKTNLCAIELEQAILGAILLEREALPEVADILKPSYFYDSANSIIYKAIQDLYNSGAHVDLRIVLNQLRKNGDLDKVGGPAYLVGLMGGVASSSHIVTYAHVVVEYAVRREIIKRGLNVIESAKNQTEDTLKLLSVAEKAFFEINDMVNLNKPKSGSGNFLAAVRFLEESARSTSIPRYTGYESLDGKLGELTVKTMNVIAARPGQGKTSFMLNIMLNLAKRSFKAGFFSLEMCEISLAMRLIAIEMGVPFSKLQEAKLLSEDDYKVISQTRIINSDNIFYETVSGITPSLLKSKCRRLVREHNVQFIFVDYLQLIRSEEKCLNREQEISSISRSLRQIALELDITLIVASQLSRGVESRTDKTPQLCDLRESGAIEQDADRVIFLTRPETYGITQDEKGRSTQGLAYVAVAKNRNGRTGKVSLQFEGRTQRFTTEGISSTNSF